MSSLGDGGRTSHNNGASDGCPVLFNPLKRVAIAATGTLFRHVFTMCHNPILHDLPTLLIKLTKADRA